MRYAVLAFLVMLAMTDLSSQATRRQADPAETLYLRCGFLWDGIHEEPQVNRTITVVGSRITAVVTSMRATASRVVDLTGLTCLPGLIDVHTHVLLQGDISSEREQAMTQRVVAGVANARRALDYGFTTIRDMNNFGIGYADVDIARAIARGLLAGPRMQVATTGLTNVVQPNLVACVTPAECRRLVHTAVSRGADWIKVFADRGVRLQSNATFDDVPTLSVEDLAAIVEEAHALGKRVAAHASGKTSVHNAVAAGVDSIEHGMYVAPEDILTMARRRIWYVPTPYQILRPALASPEAAERMKRGTDVIADTLRRAIRGGVPVAFGSDVGAFAWTTTPAAQFPIMVQHGMTPLEAVRSATSDAAEMLHLQHQLGTIETGKFADIIAVRGNPLRDVGVLQHVEFIMKEGQIVKPAR